MNSDIEKQIRDEESEEEYKAYQMSVWSKRKSKCVKGRTKHIFHSPKTHGKPLDDDKCWYCRKTYSQVKQERKEISPEEQILLLKEVSRQLLSANDRSKQK
jgi:hypothetical protein